MQTVSGPTSGEYSEVLSSVCARYQYLQREDLCDPVVLVRSWSALALLRHFNNINHLLFHAADLILEAHISYDCHACKADFYPKHSILYVVVS